MIAFRTGFHVLLLRFLIGCGAFLIALSALIVLAQDFFVIPALSHSLFQPKAREPSTIPKGIESFFLSTADGFSLEVWRMSPPSPTSSKTAILFHGNGDTVESFIGVQSWFRDMGITTYSVDYRGIGKSSGWPSEKGFYKDAEALWNHVSGTEKVPAANMIVFGISLGTGPAAYIANKFHPDVLMLLAPYLSLPRVVERMEYYKYLVRFLWYEFPVKSYVAGLSNTCLIIAHGKNDALIPISHSEELAASSPDKSHTHLIIQEAHHGDIFGASKGKMAQALSKCFERDGSRGSGAHGIKQL